MYKPPLSQPQLDRTPISSERTVFRKTSAIAKKAGRHNLAKLMTCVAILLPANIAVSAPTYLGSKPSAEADSGKFTQKVNIILAQESSQLPLSIRYGGTEARGGFVLMQLTAPNRDTTQPAYGGKLRLYDVHLAKMFETSHFLCQQSRGVSGYEWVYSAGNGSIRMGNFRISCSLASETASTYGLGKPERTSIARDTEGGRPESDVYSIPILDITGSRVQRWINFMQNFKPCNINTRFC
ncbi:hypothetical protein QUB17_11440 [Microcoleus sp. B5-C4]|uniref:hypothetical protein n=1 Tax=Microcoleus sp. B5-C4 TaxID=2818675 RepID=UPI002FD5BCAA